MVTGRARLLVHPRIDKYLLFASLFFLIMPFFSLERLTSKRPSGASPFRYAPFIVVLSFALVLQAIPISGRSALVDRELSGSQPVGRIGLPEAQPPASQPQQGLLEISEENHVRIMTDIQTLPEAYVGVEVEFIGFVIKRTAYAADEVLVGRFVMWCCVADVVVLGLMCKTEHAAELERESWLKVKGLLSVMEQDGKLIPLVIVQAFEHIDPPENEYVYP
jgi:putative membrane protein